MSRPGRATSVGLLVVAASFVVYWLADRGFDAGRGDFFYLADAFLHGRSWLDFAPGPYDVIVVGRPVLRALRAVPGRRSRCPSSPSSGR